MNEEKKKRIAVVWSNRSEEGLLRPVIDELEKHELFEVEEWKIPDDIFGVAEYVVQLQHAGDELPDLAITPYDRPPVTLMAFFFYHVNVPLVQFHAGDISSGTFDDMDRFCISLWAKYHFCAGEIQAKRLRKFLKSVGRDAKHVYVSGVTNLDNLGEIAEPPDGDYDMVMYNPPTSVPERISDEVTEIVNLLDINRTTYWLRPNGDPGSEYIVARVKDLAKTRRNLHFTETMPHDAFLGLLSRAKRAIGNSSCLFFEAPYFGAEVHMIGERNRVREGVKLAPGGSKRIVRRLARWVRENEG